MITPGLAAEKSQDPLKKAKSFSGSVLDGAFGSPDHRHDALNTLGLETADQILRAPPKVNPNSLTIKTPNSVIRDGANAHEVAAVAGPEALQQVESLIGAYGGGGDATMTRGAAISALEQAKHYSKAQEGDNSFNQASSTRRGVATRMSQGQAVAQNDVITIQGGLRLVRQQQIQPQFEAIPVAEPEMQAASYEPNRLSIREGLEAFRSSMTSAQISQDPFAPRAAKIQPYKLENFTAPRGGSVNRVQVPVEDLQEA